MVAIGPTGRLEELDVSWTAVTDVTIRAAGQVSWAAFDHFECVDFI